MVEPCEGIGIDPATPCRETLQLMPEGTASVMYFLFVVALGILLVGFGMKIQAYRRGGEEVAWDHPWKRTKNLLRIGLLQARTARKKYAGPMHQLIYWGFLVLFAGTVLVLIDYDITLPLFQYQFLTGNFYLVFEFLLDLFGLLFLIGLGMAIQRRRTRTPGGNYTVKKEDVWILGSLALLGVQGFLVEALRLALTQPAWAPYSFGGYALSFAFRPLSATGVIGAYQFLWWFHAITLFTWVATIPFTKMQHIFTSPANIFFSTQGTQLHKGELPKPFDLQKALETGDLDIKMGAQKLEDFSWRQLLMYDACTECGRCTDVCPAHAAGRPLSPMHVILGLRDEMHRQTGDHWRQSIASTEPVARGPPTPPTGNQLVDAVVGNVTLWSCVTCRACMEACPVQIEHVPAIVDMRRGLVMESRLDGNQTRLLNNLANTGNPYGFPTNDRAAWADGLDVPRIADVPDPSGIEVLYWVGCSGSYDARNQKVSRALVKVLKAANVRFAILGNEERCNGDPARRLGEESRFQELVITNVGTLKKYNVRNVITQCPHCFNTLKNEYARFGLHLSVEHHTQFVERLLREGRLKTAANLQGSTTYHDPCYLGRYNDEYDAPRTVLVQLSRPGQVPEMHRHHNNSFCCGAGGSNMWFEVKQERERMSQIRLKEARATGANRLATACPFCMTMFDDAARVAGDESFQVKDFVELVAENLEPA